MRSWWSPSGEAGADAPAADEMARRFVEASRRAEIVTLVNSARSLESLAEEVAAELCEAFEAEIGFLLTERAPGAPLALAGATGLVGEQRTLVLESKECRSALRDPEGVEIHGPDLLGLGVRRLMLEPFTATSGGRILLGVGRQYEQPYDPAERALLAAVTRSAGHAVERFWLGEDRARQGAQQASLARAAKSLNASLERDEVLAAICREVSGALGADVVNVYFGDDTQGLVAVASTGVGDDFVGFRRAPGEGLAGRAVHTGRPQMTNAYQDEGFIPDSTAALNDIRTGLSAPLHRHDKVDGAISVGFLGQRWVDDRDLALLGAFAELASMAVRNADEHADARRRAMIDPLTGCLNHGAFQTLLREEIARCERGVGEGAGFVLAFLDLQHFKSVNERFGHPAGDDLLRRVGDTLRSAVRAYDQVARYGGDEFALLLPNTTLEAADVIIERARESLENTTGPDGHGVALWVGLAAWHPGAQAVDVVEFADAAVRAHKRGEAQSSPSLVGPTQTADAAETRRRSDRRARRLAAAGRIGGRLARLLEASAIADAAVNELQAAVGAEWCRLVRLHEDGYVSAVAQSGGRPSAVNTWTQPQDEGAIGRCLRERRPVLRSVGTSSWPAVELAVPVVSGGKLWGAVDLLGYGDHSLTAEDADFVEVVGDHLGAALHTADLYRRLDQAYLGTAEALAAALEAKDDYTADHARSIADLAVAVGRELDLDEDALRDLRYGAIFHDIGKIAIPDAILNKAGPLTDDEFDVIKTHPIVGEQILAPVPFLANVRRIVRHDHERWDGTGYPDGLRGPQIPIGARIVLVVDAWHAMTSDRPYRARMSDADARRELTGAAGSQFDPAVVDAFLRIVDSEAHAL